MNLGILKTKRSKWVAAGLFFVIIAVVAFVVYEPPIHPCSHIGDACHTEIPCVAWSFGKGGVQLTLQQNMARNLTYFYLELRGCENYSLSSFGSGENKTFRFSEVVCSSIAGGFWTDVITEWWGDDGVGHRQRKTGCVLY